MKRLISTEKELKLNNNKKYSQLMQTNHFFISRGFAFTEKYEIQLLFQIFIKLNLLFEKKLGEYYEY